MWLVNQSSAQRNFSPHSTSVRALFDRHDKVLAYDSYPLYIHIDTWDSTPWVKSDTLLEQHKHKLSYKWSSMAHYTHM